jgi:hypothetical protein
VIVLDLDDVEVQLLRELLAQYDELVVAGEADSSDPVIGRLFPTAYTDDPDAAAEFERYTRESLIDTKTANSGAVAAALAADNVVQLSDEDAEQWLPVLTDLRLVLAERLGIRADDDQVPDDGIGEIYNWLGELQATIIAALDGPE